MSCISYMCLNVGSNSISSLSNLVHFTQNNLNFLQLNHLSLHHIHTIASLLFSFLKKDFYAFLTPLFSQLHLISLIIFFVLFFVCWHLEVCLVLMFLSQLRKCSSHRLKHVLTAYVLLTFWECTRYLVLTFRLTILKCNSYLQSPFHYTESVLGTIYIPSTILEVYLVQTLPLKYLESALGTFYVLSTIFTLECTWY